MNSNLQWDVFVSSRVLVGCPTDYVNADLADHPNNSSGFDESTEGCNDSDAEFCSGAVLAPKDAGEDTRATAGLETGATVDLAHLLLAEIGSVLCFEDAGGVCEGVATRSMDLRHAPQAVRVLHLPAVPVALQDFAADE